MTIATVTDLRARLSGVATIGQAGLDVHDEARLRGQLMDDLAFAAVFAEAEAREAARWVIWAASQAVGCGSASIHDLYLARGRGGKGGARSPPDSPQVVAGPARRPPTICK